MKIEKVAIAKNYKISEGIAYGPNGALRPAPDSKGYLRFNVGIKGKQFTCWVHRLVAFQKFGEAIHAPGIDVRHLDGNRQNNQPENIAIGSRSENLCDAPKSERVARANRMNETKHGALWQRIDAALDSGKTLREAQAEAGCSYFAVWSRNLKRKDRN